MRAAMQPASAPWWQQVTALVSVSTSGVITGLHFAPKAAGVTSPSSTQVRLLALDQAAQPARADGPAASDALLRSAVVKVARYYLRLAAGKTPAEMEALIWQRDSLDGVDHGESCAAFASLTLELGAQMVGQQSWVSGGTTYPWPLHAWADVRVDPNPSSLGITSVRQDAQAHHRWHPLGDGYQPQPGDWVVFHGHVEVVTGYAGGVLSTIGGDSLPNFSVNGHDYRDPLASQGVAGFVNNGSLPVAGRARGGSAAGGEAAAGPAAAATGAAGGTAADAGHQAAAQHAPGQQAPAQPDAGAGQPVIPGMAEAGTGHTHSGRAAGAAAIPGTREAGVVPPPAPQATAPQNPAASHAPAAQTPGARAPAPAASPAGSYTPRGISRLRPGAGTGASTGTKPAASTGSPASTGPAASTSAATGAACAPGQGAAGGNAVAAPASAGAAAIPGLPAAVQTSGSSAHAAAEPSATAASPTAPSPTAASPSAAGTAGGRRGKAGTTATAPGSQPQRRMPSPSPHYTRHDPPAPAPRAGSAAQQAFIGEVAPGAIAAQHKYGVPASVTIAQAIDESAWGQSVLARKDHNLFGIKGTGPAGTDALPTQEYQNGEPVSRIDLFRAYHDAAESIDDHGRLLATSAYYRQAMAAREDPNAFAASLTGIYATDPGYGAKLIRIMRQYDLYRYDATAASRAPRGSQASPGPSAATPSIPGVGSVPGTMPAAASQASTAVPRQTRTPAEVPSPTSPGATAPDATSPAPTTAPPGSVPRPAPATRRTAAPARAAAPAGQMARVPGLPGAAPSPQTVSAQRIPPDPRPPARSRTPAPRTPPAPRTAAPHLPAPPRASWPAAPRARVTPAPRSAAARAGRYQQHMPGQVRTAFLTTAKEPLIREEPLYQDVASFRGIRWELLAACDWMQCKARPRYSPVHGEKLGTLNPDGTVYRTRSEALAQCADDLAELAWAVYGIDLTAPGWLSIRELANVFAAFRWGGLLALHNTSAMEFPYSVAGLTVHHLNMRWPNIDDPHAPDKPGSRFRMPFGAVPIVLGLNYPATV
jgi:flagellum-specific peptidoglycan hydrolase FlgJ